MMEITYFILFTTYMGFPAVVAVEVVHLPEGYAYRLRPRRSLYAYKPLQRRVSRKERFQTPAPILDALNELDFVQVPQPLFEQLVSRKFWPLSAYEQYVNNSKFSEKVNLWQGDDGM